MPITKGIFQALHLAIEALNEEPRDPMRVEYAINHLEFIQAMQALEAFNSQSEMARKEQKEKQHA